MTEVARSLEFSDQVANLADRVIHGMTMGGKNEYNAVHLRIEKDARDWSQIMGGEQVLPHHILLIIKTVVLIIIIVKIIIITIILYSQLIVLARYLLGVTFCSLQFICSLGTIAQDICLRHLSIIIYSDVKGLLYKA